MRIVSHDFCTAKAQLARTGVAVEKVVFFTNGLKFGDKKCLPGPKKSLVGHPSATNFYEFSVDDFFNGHRLMHSSIRVCAANTVEMWISTERQASEQNRVRTT
jgi:hypothetical protein